MFSDEDLSYELTFLPGLRYGDGTICGKLTVFARVDNIELRVWNS